MNQIKQMIKEIVFCFCAIFATAMLTGPVWLETVYKYFFVSHKQWVHKIKATMPDGTPIEILVYDEPLSDGGFAINVHRNDDPPGQCWGTVIYPKQCDRIGSINFPMEYGE